MKTRMSDWVTMYADMNWEQYGGKWAYPDPADTLAWYVLDFVNMWDATGDDSGPQYVCEVNYVDLKVVPDREMASALRSCGPSQEDLEGMSKKDQMFAIMVALHDYGIKAPLHTVEGSRADSVRAEARRYAEDCMSDPALMESSLDRTVNKIGSSARDFMYGDIDAGLRRAAEDIAAGRRAPTTEERILMKMYAASGGQTLGGKTPESVALSRLSREALAIQDDDDDDE